MGTSALGSPLFGASPQASFCTSATDNTTFFANQQRPEEVIDFGNDARNVTFDSTQTNVSDTNQTLNSTTSSSPTETNANVNTFAPASPHPINISPNATLNQPNHQPDIQSNSVQRTTPVPVPCPNPAPVHHHHRSDTRPDPVTHTHPQPVQRPCQPELTPRSDNTVSNPDNIVCQNDPL